ncbi:Homeobox protein [Actinidia chinensis var. chinensis]|uniref:Homeobox protein n=1 Tax=Actinidia chinensis var. chinensis TaxID=1590841 RepID=A0A2R6Q735_ACTCC|nr:Homeobox protein [Actinidia chinensis var. chinensis]
MVQGIGSREALFGYVNLHNSVMDSKNSDFSGFQSSNCKKMRISSESNQEDGGEMSSSGSGQTSPLGLTLRKTPSFLSLVEMKLSQSRTKKHKTEDPEKLKATNFPALLLKIGAWERFSRHEGDLVAKCYYAKKKIVWEVLEGALKSKIEIQWSDIEAIRAIIRNDEPGILEIELNQPPMFFRETNPQPRKHTLWQASSDFTSGQAHICRRHCVKFPPGTLDKHYEKLLQCDKRLFELSKRPFPGLASPYFYSNIYGDTDVSFDFQAFQSQVPHGLHQRSFSAIPSSSFVPPNSVHNLRLPTGQPISIVGSNSPMSVMDFPRIDENANSYTFENQMAAHWGQEGNIVENIYARGDQIQGLSPSLTSETQVGAAFLCHGYQIPTYRGIARRPDPNTTILSDIENHWLGNSLGPCQLFDPSKEPNFSHNIGTNQFGYEHENLSDGNAILNPAEHFEVDGGPLYPQPISYLPPQVSNALMMPGENYPYASPFPNYEDVDAGREEQQWP